ncbi:hypothetical protein BG011_006249 [Mortierella polycephala]|uniref:DUF1212-domain-containing protein n=1 Tax=Mortierella polycephala TaxID=41804 RepID=A0A9P6PWK3_9FUNG|nr:hypothetical protein BG011_006249 [Mortierella polycephala]
MSDNTPRRLSPKQTTTTSASTSAPTLVRAALQPHSQSESQARLNIELNQRSLPIGASTSTNSHQPSTYPSIPRFSPAVPSKRSENYIPNTLSTIQGHNGLHNGRRGTKSASNSPPGTPPSGLRNYYLNAAYHRSQQHLYPKGSIPGSTTSLQRPALSVVVPNARHLSTGPGIARRSYSADHLQVEEPEITVTSPGGTSTTENHVMTLQRALSNLIESEGREDEGEEEDGDDWIMMRGSKPSTPSPAPPGTPPRKKGVTKYPKVVIDRLDPEKATIAALAGATSTFLTHGAGGSDITLAPPPLSSTTEISEKGHPKSKVEKASRLSKLIQRDITANTKNQDYTMTAASALARQPSKTGILSNLLKLQGDGRLQKQHHVSRPKPAREKKPKRPTMYKRSANNSTASLTAMSMFSTNPPLPLTPPLLGANTATLSNFQPSPRNAQRHSIQFDNAFGQSFSAANSPMQSPNGSRRCSFSEGETPPGMASLFFDGGYNGTGDGSGNADEVALSNEEKMRITIAMADILERQDYVLRLAKSLIKYGAPSHRLEDAVDQSAKILELNLQCIYLPNMMIIAFTDYETHTSETHLLKASADLDMYKCALVHQVQKMVTHSAMPVEEAIMKLDAINAEKDANPRWLNILAYAVASFSTAPMFFKGSWIDAGVSLLIGGAIGLLVWLSEKVPSYSHICVITMSLVVAFVAEALHNHVCQSAVKLAGIIILLPGYTITSAILELSSRHIISGSVRLFYAMVFSLLLGYGLTIGGSIWRLIDTSVEDGKFAPECSSAPLDAKWNILFVPLFAISLNIWLKAHPRQWSLAVVLSIVGYAISYSTSIFAGAQTEVSSALAAFAIGLFGNIYQRLTKQLSFQAVVCAVFFLVPGSLGLKGALGWFTDDMTGGVNLALQMIVTAIAISVGLFTSALVVYPMGKTRSAQMTF